MSWTALEFRQLLHRARPAFEPLLRDLLAHRACVRCCLRFAGLRSFGSDLTILERQPPPASALLQALSVPVDHPAASGTAEPAVESQLAGAKPAEPSLGEQAVRPAAAAASEEDAVCALCAGVLQSQERVLAEAPTAALLKAAIAKLGLQPDVLHQPSGNVTALGDAMRCAVALPALARSRAQGLHLSQEPWL